jgi:hypothetical protein
MLATRKIGLSRGDGYHVYRHPALARYDSVAFLVLLIGIGLLEVIVWSI